MILEVFSSHNDSMIHVSKYGSKNGVFYSPAGRAPADPREASTNCRDLSCFRIRPLTFTELHNDDHYRRYYSTDLL